MGPRFFDRGNQVVPARADRLIALLQWGRGSLTAETKSSMGAAVFQPRLQWGRGSLTAETGPSPEEMERYQWLQWGRGSLTAETCARGSRSARHGPASMGPRFFDRGNERGSGCWSHGPTLQWGRGSLTAETLQTEGWRIGYKVLQWGRGSLTAETRIEADSDSQSGVASMGPRFFDRGNPCQSTPAVRSSVASMGPRFFDRGNYRRP